MYGVKTKSGEGEREREGKRISVVAEIHLEGYGRRSISSMLHLLLLCVRVHDHDMVSANIDDVVFVRESETVLAVSGHAKGLLHRQLAHRHTWYSCVTNTSQFTAVLLW